MLPSFRLLGDMDGMPPGSASDFVTYIVKTQLFMFGKIESMDIKKNLQTHFGSMVWFWVTVSALN